MIVDRNSHKPSSYEKRILIVFFLNFFELNCYDISICQSHALSQETHPNGGWKFNCFSSRYIRPAWDAACGEFLVVLVTAAIIKTAKWNQQDLKEILSFYLFPSVQRFTFGSHLRMRYTSPTNEFWRSFDRSWCWASNTALAYGSTRLLKALPLIPSRLLSYVFFSFVHDANIQHPKLNLRISRCMEPYSHLKTI